MLGVTLAAGERLRVRQSDATSSSDFTAFEDQVVVLGAPHSQPGAVTIRTHPYACGQCLYVEGAFPGAQVRLFDGSWTRALASAIGPIARLSVTPGLALADHLFVEQAVGASVGPAVPLGEVEPPPSRNRGPLVVRNDRIEPPEIREPVSACAGSFLIEGVVDGATVEVERRGKNQVIASFERACVDVYAVHWSTPSLQEGEELRARQWLCNSPAEADFSRPVIVGPAVVGVPYALSPCERDRTVRVQGLASGADVTLTVTTDGRVDTYRGSASGSAGTFGLPAGAMSRRSEVAATQALCGLTVAGPSVAVRAVRAVRAASGQALAPRFAASLYEWATVVRVTNVPVGASVRIISSFYESAAHFGSGCISDEVFVVGPKHHVDVPVIALEAGDSVWAVVRTCGKDHVSAPEPVLRMGDLPKPEVPVVTTCGPIVARRLIPGALVELYVDGVFVPPRVLTPVDTHVFPRPRTLQLGQEIVVRQRMWGTFAISNPQIVVAGALRVAQPVARLQQLTGDKDPEPKLPPLPGPTGIRPDTNKTFSRYGLPGMDLGVPVEHLGQLYFFFGDTKVYERLPDGTQGDPLTPFIRPIVIVTDSPDEPSQGVRIDYLVDTISFGGTTVQPVHPLTVPSDRPDETFFVPTGGFSYDGRIYVFMMEKVINVAWGPPLPLAKEGIETWESENFGLGFHAETLDIIGGRSTLASGRSPTSSFDAVKVCDIRDFSLAEAGVAWKFTEVCPLVFAGSDVPGLGHNGDVLLLWGTGAPRLSDVCFAWAPLQRGQPIPDVKTWNYFVGLDSLSRPLFSTNMRDAIGVLRWSDTRADPTPPSDLNVTTYHKKDPASARPPLYTAGEFSVVYVRELRGWLMLATGPRVWARIAQSPWGPWSPSVDLPLPATGFTNGPYAPYMIAQYIDWLTDTNALRVNFVASFLGANDEHGQVHMFEVELTCAP